MEKIVITAANGFLGEHLATYLSEYYEIVGLVRKNKEPRKNIKYVIWDGKNLGGWKSELEGAKCVINLAGRSVNCRYNTKNKNDIYSSRIDSTMVIGTAIRQCSIQPEVWINAASATIYRHSIDKAMTEENGEIGCGFSVDVCKKWEQSFFSFKNLATRQIALRTAIVLGADGGVMVPFRRLVKFGFGGKMGPLRNGGKQMFSWIHVFDFCRAIDLVLKNSNIHGIINVSAPKPITNAVFMHALRRFYKVPFGIPLPVWMLNIGAFMINTETELILKSRFVIPEKLTNLGFEFNYPDIDSCLSEISH